MFNIGNVRMEKASFKDENGQDKEVKWLECYIMAPGMVPFSVKMSENKNKQNENSPDYFLYKRNKFNKNVSFRESKIGSLWIKQREVEDGYEKFMAGMMLLGTEEVSIMVFKAKPLYEGEKLNYLYDVVIIPNDDFKNEKNNETDYSSGESVGYETQMEYPHADSIDIDEEEIPF